MHQVANAAGVSGACKATSTNVTAAMDHPETSEKEYEFLRDLLSRPDVWAAPDPSIEDAIVAAIRAEAQKDSGATHARDRGPDEHPTQ